MNDDDPGLSSGEAGPDVGPAVAPYILLLEDSPGEAELFCQALICAWERQVSKPVAPRPIIDVQYTAQGALDALNAHIALKPNGLSDLPDLIVLDLDLPAGNSLTFLREIRRDVDLSKLPVIAMVWADDEPTIRALGGQGVAGYVIKPMLFEDLIVLVGDVCRHFLFEKPHHELCEPGRELLT
ncbi:MAG TPA: response regulator [Nitrospira sp.]|nr:response regulator [Nitrospira sp.]